MIFKKQAEGFVVLPRSFVLICLVLGCFASQVAVGKESSSSATRTVLYQAETIQVLSRHGWKVTLDRPGKLVADQPYNVKNGFFGPQAFSIQLVRLIIDFIPETSGHTKCKALVVGYSHLRKVHADKLGFKTYTNDLAGPFPMNTPDNVKEIQDAPLTLAILRNDQPA